MKSIYGNWDNQHASRFNANLGASVMVLGVVFCEVVFGTGLIIASMFLIMNTLQMSCAYYYYRYPDEWQKVEKT